MSVDKLKFSTKPGSLKTCRWRRSRERAGLLWPFWSAKNRLSQRSCSMGIKPSVTTSSKRRSRSRVKPFSISQAKESAEKVRLAYQGDGYFNCRVIPVVQTLDEDRKRLTFFI